MISRLSSGRLEREKWKRDGNDGKGKERTWGLARVSLRSWRYCVGARLKFWRRSRVPKKGSRDEALKSYSTTLHRLRRQISLDYYTIPPATQARRECPLFPSRAYYFLRLLLWDGCEGVSMSKKLSLALLVIVFTAATKIRTLGTRCTGKK